MFKTTTTTTTTVLWPFVRDYPGEPVPEETLTHPPSNLCQLLPSTDPPCSNYVLDSLFAQPLSMSSLVYLLVWSPPPHFFTKSMSSFCNTCPYHCSLFCCSINIISSIPSLPLNSLLGTLCKTTPWCLYVTTNYLTSHNIHSKIFNRLNLSLGQYVKIRHIHRVTVT